MRPALGFTSLLALTLAVGCGPDSPPVDDTDAGSQQDAGPNAEPDAGGDPGPDAGAEPDAGADPEVAPTVVASWPADGEAGISPEHVITVTFSEPMDQATVEASFSSNTIEDVTFAWNAAQTVLSVTPVGGLDVAQGEGLDPSVIDALEYDFTIGTGAESAEGVALEAPYAVTFTTHKLMLATVDTLVADLTRTRLSNGTVHSVDHPTLYAGDSAYVADTQLKAFITFDISALPDDVEIVAAALRATQSEVNGSPYELLGALELHHVMFDAVDEAAFDAEPLRSLGEFSNASLGMKSTAVLAALVDDYQNREERGNRSQYRLAFELPYPEADQGNSAVFAKDAVYLRFTYTAK